MTDEFADLEDLFDNAPCGYLAAGPDGRIAMRFEVAYGHAFKALPRVQAGQPTTVSLDEMRSLVRSRRK